MSNRGRILGMIPLFLGLIILILTFLWPGKGFNPDTVAMLVGFILSLGGGWIMASAWNE